jgi:ribosomal protein S18 acetylase RimI-like enzyme
MLHIIETIVDSILTFLIDNIVNYFVGIIMPINDTEKITEIVNKSFETVANQFGYTKENAPTFPAFIKKDIIKENINNGLKMYCFKKHGKIMGCIGYSKYTDERYKIKRLAVLPEYRHKGIGKKLLEYGENEIQRKGGIIIEVHIVNDNEKLKEWYIKNGYNEIKIEEIKGLPFKVGIMQKNNIKRAYCV